jgi:LmbE family N-acetylglucosaminyl deacetylase
MEETPRQVLVVIPHPDDAEFWCAGTVAKWITQGASVCYVLCTDGDKGSNDPHASSQELGPTREREQREATRILGVQEVVTLHHPDGELEDTRDFRREIVREIRRFRPELVLCPEPYRRNLAWHRDHRIAGQVTLDAVFPWARDHLHFVELWEEEGLEPHKTGTVLFWGAEQPDTQVDISDTIGVKIQAVLAHRSQVTARTGPEVEEFVKEWAKNAGADQGYSYAEAFRKLTFRT